ncbi:Rop family plasmid primer RNA-binding protein [Enterobacter asburiae]|uniref:Rop family plasmid primer RNA-binding protein n=1 Tax=Enterobacter asburiae TaxID=61645 RepID=UPI0030760458
MAKTPPNVGAYNMAKFIRAQSLLLLEKVDALDWDEASEMAEDLHDLAEKLEHFTAEKLKTSDPV